MDNDKKPESYLCVSPIVREQRINICNQCEEKIDYLNVCNKCVCYIPWKTWFNNTECPKNKW